MDDSVSIDAKRILLRYGAPIAILDRVDDKARVELAREVARTDLPDRENRLRELLIEREFMTEEEAPAIRKKKKKRKK